MSDEKKPQTPREIMDKIYEMTPEEFNLFMHDHFQRMCNRPLSSPDRTTNTDQERQ